MRQQAAAVVLVAALFVVGLVVQSSQFATQMVSTGRGQATPPPLEVADPAPVETVHEPLETPTRPSPVRGVAEDALRWSGTRCLDGTQLNHAKVAAACKQQQAKGVVHVHGKLNTITTEYCHDVLEASAGNPVCGQWASGKFSHAIDSESLDMALDAYRKIPRRCSSRDLASVGRFEFQGDEEDEILGVADASCTIPNASPIEALGVTAAAAGGRGVLFSGDSMMRQAFLRLIAVIRGQTDRIADHYFHFDAVYVVTTSGEDALIPLAGNKVSDAVRSRRIGTSGLTVGDVMASHFSGYSGFTASSADAAAGSTSVVLAMMFNWETKPSMHRREFASMAPRLHIASFMYWWQNKDPLTDLDRYTTAVEAHYAKARNDAPFRFVWLTTPWTAPKLFGGVEPPIRKARNDKAKSWVKSLSKLSTTVHSSVVDFDAIADATKMPKTRDGIHYMCIWTPKLPDTVTGMKDNGQRCRDPMNRAVANVLIATLAGDR